VERHPDRKTLVMLSCEMDGTLVTVMNPGRHVNGQVEIGRHARSAQQALATALFFGTVAMVLLPYTTLTLRHRQALQVQAAGIFLVALAMLVVGALHRGVRGLGLREHRVPLAGLGLWTAFAVLAGLIGVVHGNNLTLVAGQLLSLGLLPLGALAGAALWSRGAWRWFRWGVVAATTVAALVHLGFWVLSLSSGTLFKRLLLPNGVSPSGVSLLALLMALSLAGSRGRRQRMLGVLCALIIVLFIFGAAVRSLWIVAIPAVAVFQIWTGVRASAGRLLGVAAGVLACILAGAVPVAVWLHPERPNLLPNGGIGHPAGGWRGVKVVTVPAEQGNLAFRWTPSAARSVQISRAFSVHEGAYRLRTWLRGGHTGGARIALHCNDTDGVYLASGYARTGPTPVWRLAESTFLLPAGSAICGLYFEVDGNATGTWLARPVSLERLGDASFFTVLAVQLQSTWKRSAGVLRDLLSGRGIQDPTIADRLAESAAVVTAIREGGLAEKLLGHGLGATFRYRTSVRDASDHWQTVDSQNYIHNFLLFLAFKLGLLGALGMTAALISWIGWTARKAKLLLPGTEGVFLAAAAVAWTAYVVWGVACPEILDYRVAPLWGLLLAASANASGVQNEDAT